MENEYRQISGIFGSLYRTFVYGRDDISNIPEDKKVKMRKQAIYKVMPGIIAGVLACTIPITLNRYEGRKHVEPPRITIEQVLDKAAGDDKLLSRDERIKLARDLGYYDVIVEDEPLEFDYQILSDDFGLVKGNRQLCVFSQDTLRKYMGQ